MSSKALKGMAIAYWAAAGLPRDEFTVDGDDISRLKASLLWLADNVSDEMVAAALRTTPENLRAYKDSPALSLMIDAQRHDISAAIRAAAEGSAPPPPEVK